MNRKQLSLFVGLVVSAASDGQVIDLMKAPVLMRGASFKASYHHINTTAEHYYSAINDGDRASWWEPMEMRGPHFIEMLWNQPVRASSIHLTAADVSHARLMKWCGGEWKMVVSALELNADVHFPEAESERWRLEVVGESAAPKIHEMSLFGPDQYILPPEIPAPVGVGRVTLSDAVLPTATFHPGDIVEIAFHVQAHEGTEPYGLMIELSDRAALQEMRDGGSDYCSGRWAAKPDAEGKVTIRMELPPWTPHGRNDILVTALADASGRRIKVNDNLLGSIDVSRPDLPPMLEPAHEVSVGTNAAGQRGFVVNGKWHPAFFNRFYGHPTPERLAATAQTGLKILYWQNRDGIPIDEADLQRRLDWFDQRIRMALRICPQNYFILSQVIKAGEKWLAKHPQEMMLLDNGEVNPRKLVSFGSNAYLAESEAFVVRLVDFISRQPYGDRVIGYHLWTCTQNDGFVGGAQPNSKMSDRKDFILGDYHPGALRRFREFLKRKYHGDVAEFRQAWHDETADFDQARVPRAVLVQEDMPCSAFRDPVRARSAIDYLEFFPSLIGGYNSHIAAAIKRESKGRALVLIHSGAVKGYMGYAWAQQLQSNNNDLATLQEDPNIDVFVQAQPYDTREAGNAMHVYQPSKSLDLHGKLYLFDHDHRTLGAGTLKYGRHRSQYEGDSVFARDYGHQWLDNAGAWISDMSLSRWWSFNEYRLPWYTMPEVVNPIRHTLAALEKLQTPRQSKTEVAVVLSLNSPRYEDACRMVPLYKGLVNDLLLQDGLPYLGAPHDVILSSDLGRADLPEYKLYLFLNPTYFTSSERAAINRLKRDSKVLAWFYAPGYVTDDGCSLEAVHEISGFNLKVKDKACETPELIFQANLPLSKGLESKLLTTVTWFGLSKFSPVAMSPLFYADDPAVAPAGRYADGTVAYGVKDFGNWKSVWCGVPNFSLSALVNLARFAGVHLYAEAPVVLNADNRMMMIHNGYEGARDLAITLPGTARVSDLKTGATVAEGTAFTVHLASPETRLLKLEYVK